MSKSTLHNDRATWLKGPEASCSVTPPRLERPWHIVLSGAPGVGKGTQAQLLSKKLFACHLSTGDVFRNAKNLGQAELTPAMDLAVNCMREGKLVPDRTVLDLIRERSGCLRCTGGFILDGFPRTLPQADALERLLEEQKIRLDAVLDFVMPIEQIVARLSGRRTCPACKAVYHVQSRPPKRENICDLCQTALLQREDDRPESIRIRMAAYEESTAPLTLFYQTRNLLLQVSALGTPEEISSRAAASLQEKRH